LAQIGVCNDVEARQPLPPAVSILTPLPSLIFPPKGEKIKKLKVFPLQGENFYYFY
jgi:hypothetical protein